ncbi:MAG: hypothetical protein ACE15C_03365 [Phycisphaerae bacterium]
MMPEEDHPARDDVAGVPASWRGQACDLVFGILGPAGLSIGWWGAFWQSNYLPPYPWHYAGWSYCITVIDLAAVILWMTVRASPGLRWSRCAGVMAGVFLAGALHSLACAAIHTPLVFSFFSGWTLFFAPQILLAWLAAAIYFRLMLQCWRRCRAEFGPLTAEASFVPGFLTPLVLAAAAQVAFFGVPFWPFER